MVALKVVEPSQIGAARREAGRMADHLGLSAAEAGRLALVVTELAANLARHAAEGGEMVIGGFEDAAGTGVQVLALDRGPGMADVEACLRDGYSTAGSAGTGLGAVVRLSDGWDIHSAPGLGTAILARIAARPRPKSAVVLIWGGVCVPAPGETVSGDAWSLAADRRSIRLVVADGLGHGDLAARAATAVLEAASMTPDAPLPTVIRRMHEAAGPTRGAAAAVVEIDLGTALLRFAGIGNIAGTILGADRIRRTVSHTGTLGHALHRVQQFEYPFGPGSTLVLSSDGLVSSWGLDSYPGLLARHPALIAGVLFRDFRRGRDDTTVVVARHEAGRAG
jgi:anti-sigma regulatory factor (Ser/Thr protein kinase)